MLKKRTENKYLKKKISVKLSELLKNINLKFKKYIKSSVGIHTHTHTHKTTYVVINYKAQNRKRKHKSKQRENTNYQ